MNWFKISSFFLRFSAFHVAIVVSTTLFPFIVGKYSFFRASIAMAVATYCIGLLAHRDEAAEYLRRLKEAVVSPLGVAVGLFTLMFLLAGFFGVDPAMSFWSNFERGEGGLQMLHLYAFFVLLVALLKEEGEWRRMFRCVLAGGVLMALYGVFAAADFGGFVGTRYNPGFRFEGSIGNSAYVGALCVFYLGYLAYLLLARYRERRLVSIGGGFAALLGIGFFAVLLFTKTRGALLALIISVVIGGFYFAWLHKPWRKRFIAGVVILAALLVVMVQFRRTPFVQSLPIARIFDISFTTETFQHRTIMWGIAYQGFKERPLLGWGPENYIQVFDRHFDPHYYVPGQPFGAWFDRAHSIIFDYLVETGAFGLFAYLSIFLVFFWQLWRMRKSGAATRSSAIESVLLGLMVAYLVQGIVLFDVLPISYNLFLIAAFGASYAMGIRADSLETTTNHRTKKNR
jgi:O-antigen ligase